MTGFLGTLGSIGAGLGPQLDQIAAQQQQNQGNSDFGNALAAIYGGQPSTGQQQGSGPLGGLQSMLQSLSGGQQQFTPSPVTGVPQGARSAQPPVAQGGGGLPGQQPQQPQQPQPAQLPQQQQQQQASSPQPIQAPQQGAPPQPKPQGQDQQQQAGQGPLDLPTLVKHLVANGVTGKRLGASVERFIPLLNAQGLQQYRQLGLQLRQEQARDVETDREFNRDPNAPGSRAQGRVANQGIAAQRMEGVQKRFEARMSAATDKLKNAKTDKEALQAKNDLDKVAGELRAELTSELNIANAPGTSPEEQKAAMQKAAEIRQQIETATDEAIKGRRSGGDKADASNGDSGKAKTAYNAEGKQVTWNGKEPYNDPKNWTEGSGGQ